MSTLKWCTVATKQDPNLDILTTQSEHFNIPLTILGKNDSMLKEWGQNFGRKLFYVHEYIKKLSDDTIVLFTDAYDIILLADEIEIMGKFKEFQCDLLFSAELWSHPDGHKESEYDELFPQNKNDVYRFVNSGTFIGKVWALRKLYESYTYCSDTDDQRFMTHAFLDITKNKRFIDIQLDRKCSLFMCLAGRKDDLRYDHEQGRFQVFSTDEWPSILHCNGEKGETRPSFDKWNENRKIPIKRYQF